MYITVIFIFGMVILFINKKINNKSFDNLSIKRTVNKSRVFAGKEFKIKTTLENNKRLPIAIAYVEEAFPAVMSASNKNIELGDGQYKYNISKYSIWSYEKRSRSLILKSEYRGVYNINNIKITIGDFLGFFHKKKEFKNYVKIIVYPKVEDYNTLKFKSLTYFGTTPIRRWLYKDNFFIKGIREYTCNDRMKDIHWPSTAKMNKLMVREYDFTMERELMIILNICGSDSDCSSIHEREKEEGISLAASIATQCAKESVSAGFLTNATIIKDENFQKSIILPSENSLSAILEMCARIYNARKMNFSQLLKENMSNFKVNRTYIIISYYLDKESIDILKRLSMQGISICILDVSLNLTIPEIEGIEKIDFEGAI